MRSCLSSAKPQFFSAPGGQELENRDHSKQDLLLILLFRPRPGEDWLMCVNGLVLTFGERTGLVLPDTARTELVGWTQDCRGHWVTDMTCLGLEESDHTIHPFQHAGD